LYLIIFLRVQYREYEQVVVDDRVEKEKLRRKLEKDIEEVEAATKVQSLLFIVLHKLYGKVTRMNRSDDDKTRVFISPT